MERANGIRPVDFSSSVHRALPIEVIEWRELFNRLGDEHLARAQRPSFGLVFVVRAGSGLHTIDFESFPLIGGRLVRVRPGQVQQWSAGGDVDAAVVLARSLSATTDRWPSHDGPYRDLDPGSVTTAADLVNALVREQERFVADELSIRLMTALFESLVALFDRAAPVAESRALPEAYVAFRQAIEHRLTPRRTVRDHVTELGFSERTVDRACRQVTGLSAKALLDERVVLEARRLLAHTDRPVAKIAAELGFSEATNFHKFFVKRAGQRPSDFRSELRAAGYAADSPSD